jgi:hypothetical protein
VRKNGKSLESADGDGPNVDGDDVGFIHDEQDLRSSSGRHSQGSFGAASTDTFDLVPLNFVENILVLVCWARRFGETRLTVAK